MKLKRNIAVSESGFVFDPTAGESYSLNEQGIEIINMLRQDKTDEEISTYMADNYEVETGDFEKYYFDFIGMLRQFKLIEDEREI